eukprot:494908-Prymnesium_polylepis.1
MRVRRIMHHAGAARHIARYGIALRWRGGESASCFRPHNLLLSMCTSCSQIFCVRYIFGAPCRVLPRIAASGGDWDRVDVRRVAVASADSSL